MYYVHVIYNTYSILTFIIMIIFSDQFNFEISVNGQFSMGECTTFSALILNHL